MSLQNNNKLKQAIILIQQNNINIRKNGKTGALYARIIKATRFLRASAKIKERIYVISHDIANVPCCECGTAVNFMGPSAGYRQFCSTHCSAKSVATIQKKQTTCKKNHGVNSPAQSDHIRARMQQTTKDRFGVPHSQQSPAVKSKTKKTNLANWGVESHTSSLEFQHKVKQIVLNKYGVDHISQLPETQEKIRETTLKKYGVNHSSQRHLSKTSLLKSNDVDWLIEQHHTNKRPVAAIAADLGFSQSHLCKIFHKHNIQINHYFRSAGEQEMFELINEAIPCEVIQNDRSVLNGIELDIYIPSISLAFEFNGIYWHSELAGKDKKYHISKTKKCIENNIRLIQVWDIEWILKKQLVISRINNLLGKSTSIYARKCNIIIPTKSEIQIFLDLNHIQGTVGCSIAYGLTYQNQLVSVMTLGKSRFSSHHEYELIRYANKSGTGVVGGASKLFKHFTKNHGPSSVISYSDKRWNSGALYSKLGFEKKHSTPPNYFYFKRTNQLKLYSRQVFQKHKLKNKLETFDPTATEWQNMTNNGYNRIWDCGNDVYTWTPLTTNN